MRVIVCANDALENAKKNTKRMNRIMVYPDSPEQKQKRPSAQDGHEAIEKDDKGAGHG